MRIYKGQKQRGAVLIMTLILLVIMLGSSLHFFGQTMDNTKITGASRDSHESRLLAESTMELMRGRFINNLDTDATVNVTACDIGGVSLDKCEASDLSNNISDPSTSLLNYMYYISTGIGTAIDQTQPSILQKIANGEESDTTKSTLTAQKISSATTVLRINDLFGASFSPQLFATNSSTGLLENSNSASWDAETSLQKAAAWIEVLLNPDNDQAVDLYVETVSQVGNGRTYLQRYVGTYFVDDTLGLRVPALAESSEIDRETP